MDAHELMRRHLRRYVAPNEILFATGQGLSSSHDYDIYCVTRGPSKPLVHIYKEEGVWIEIFIDDWATLTEKIANYDEIVASYVRRFAAIGGVGDDVHLAQARSLLPARYKLPPARRNLILYRLLVLQGKYLEAGPDEHQLFRGPLLLNLCMLTFDALGQWPGSPKMWAHDLRENRSGPAIALVDALIDDQAMLQLLATYLQEISDIHLVRDSNPVLTFLG
jgi:hypothetical protein